MDCLEKDPKRRLSAEQLLNHSWLAEQMEDKDVDVEIIQQIFSDMNSFREQNVFQTHVLSYLRTMKLKSEQTKQIKDVFIQMDSSKDGVLTLDEIKKGMQEVAVNFGHEFDWKELFKEIDTDGSGTIDYAEFVTATVNKQCLLDQQNIDMMFKLYDTDGDG